MTVLTRAIDRLTPALLRSIAQFGQWTLSCFEHVCSMPHIFVSFAVLPPVTLATRSCSNSCFNSVSWLDKSALLLLLSSCALTCIDEWISPISISAIPPMHTFSISLMQALPGRLESSPSSGNSTGRPGSAFGHRAGVLAHLSSSHCDVLMVDGWVQGIASPSLHSVLLLLALSPARCTERHQLSGQPDLEEEIIQSIAKEGGGRLRTGQNKAKKILHSTNEI